MFHGSLVVRITLNILPKPPTNRIKIIIKSNRDKPLKLNWVLVIIPKINMTILARLSIQPNGLLAL